MAERRLVHPRLQWIRGMCTDELPWTEIDAVVSKAVEDAHALEAERDALAARLLLSLSQIDWLTSARQYLGTAKADELHCALDQDACRTDKRGWDLVSNDVIDARELVRAQSTDAEKWAAAFWQEFGGRLGDLDEHTVFGWFANAIGAAKDAAGAGAWRDRVRRDERQRVLAELRSDAVRDVVRATVAVDWTDPSLLRDKVLDAVTSVLGSDEQGTDGELIEKQVAATISSREQGTGGRDIRDWLETPEAIEQHARALADVELPGGPYGPRFEDAPAWAQARWWAEAGADIDRFLKLAEQFYASVPSQQEGDG